MNPLRFVAILLLFLLSDAANAASELPPDSVYHLDVALTDHRATTASFADQRGGVRIVSMFYANCPYVCPLIIDTIRRVERELPPAELAKLDVLLVSMDPERDDPAALANVVDKRKLDAARWTLARTAPRDVRKLAAVLGIQYRQLENREFNHSSALILLDAEGRVLARSSTLGTPDPEFVAAVRKALED